MSWRMQHLTLFDGWVDDERDGEGNIIFYSDEEEAKRAFEEYWDEIQEAVENRDLIPYDLSDYRLASEKEYMYPDDRFGYLKWWHSKE